MAILLKTASVRVSFIQIMQVRVQNKGKSVWKSRYVGDVSFIIARRRAPHRHHPRALPPRRCPLVKLAHIYEFSYFRCVVNLDV